MNEMSRPPLTFLSSNGDGLAVSRIVVKVGSQTITHAAGGVNQAEIYRLAADIAALHLQGVEVVLVSSGAIQASKDGENFDIRSGTIEELQALSAIGQPKIMQAWHQALTPIPTAQVLLTHDDLGNRQRSLNARATIQKIIEWGGIAVLNENDSVSFEEITVGDNDQLAAMVAELVEADLLLLLTGPDGVFTSNPVDDPQAKKISWVVSDHELIGIDLKSKSHSGRGGMVTKIEAAKKMGAVGIPTLILSSQPTNPLLRAFQDPTAGTLFSPAVGRSGSKRKAWLRTIVRPEARIEIDLGAYRALLSGASLLPKGCMKIHGTFRRGDCVKVYLSESGQLAGLGLVEYDSSMCLKIFGRHSSEIAKVLGYSISDEIIHRDNLVVEFIASS